VGHAREDAPLAPRSPYAAAKAAGELLVRSYVITHGVDAVVTRGSNTYGPYHHPEKLIPLFVTNALDDRPLPLYGDGLQRREWLYVSDHAPRSTTSCATARRARPTTSQGRRNGPTATSSLLLDHLGKPWSLVCR
jgi:dTDP-glucose 4,6-dehydratase